MFNKKGSHVGVILSFVIFTAFLLFLYSIMQPVITIEKDKQIILDSLKEKLVENTSADLITISVTNASGFDGNKKCLQVSKAELNIENIDAKNIRAEDKNGGWVEIKNEGDFIYLLWTTADKNVFKIYLSENIDNGLTYSMEKDKCTDLNINYIIAKEYIFKKKIEGLILNYTSDYESVKQTLKIPAGSEFSFSFANSTKGIILETEQKEVFTSVYADEIPIQYVNETANINAGFINIKVW